LICKIPAGRESEFHKGKLAKGTKAELVPINTKEDAEKMTARPFKPRASKVPKESKKKTLNEKVVKKIAKKGKKKGGAVAADDIVKQLTVPVIKSLMAGGVDNEPDEKVAELLDNEDIYGDGVAVGGSFWSKLKKFKEKLFNKPFVKQVIEKFKPELVSIKDKALGTVTDKIQGVLDKLTTPEVKKGGLLRLPFDGGLLIPPLN